MKPKTLIIPIVLALGCASDGPKVEKGPGDTIAYYIHVEASAAGSKIEVNGDYVGDSPIDVKVFGDRDGTFHSFGNSSRFSITANPVHNGQTVQTKTWGTGGWFQHEDMIPKRVYFNLDLEPVKPRERIDVNVN